MEFQENGNNNSSSQDRTNGILDSIDALLAIAADASSEDAQIVEEGTVIDRDSQNPESAESGAEEVNPLKQVHAEIASLKKQMAVIDKLQMQVAMLPSKEDIVSAVLTRLPREITTDSIDPHAAREKIRTSSVPKRF